MRTKTNAKTENSRSSKKRKNSTRNREFAFIAYLFLGIFVALMGYFTYFQVFKSEDVINNSYNKRQQTFAKTTIRGPILSQDGKVLAKTTVDKAGNETREYPYSNMFAHVIGYEDNGKAGIESTANFNLLRSNSFVLERLVNELENKKNQGDSVVTTLDFDVQKAAYDALGPYNGAVFAIDPETGKILSMVSKPDFNPNTIKKDWDSILKNQDQTSVLLNRATQGSYTPGSTFKILTTLAYLKEHPDYRQFQYQCDGSTTTGGQTVHCYGGEVHGTVNLREAFAESCNCAFVNMGLSLNPQKFRKFCDSMLFNSTLPIDFPYTKSSFVIDKNSSKAAIMQASIGQEKTTVSPLHMALIAAAIANNGSLMSPYAIDHTENNTGIIVKQYKPEEYDTLLSQQQAEILQRYMKETVKSGTATALQSSRYTAGGKTGSAQVSDSTDDTHSWFVGYAKNHKGKKIAIAVIVEKEGNGSKYAVPIAKKVFDAYFH
ncbi:MAG: penicillin-binding transpeptidase domain-containing protein [Lachnospiraceae bacterium]